MIDEAQAKAQMVLGSALVTTPIWISIFQNVSLVATTIAAVTGAIIGINGVCKLPWAQKLLRRKKGGDDGKGKT